jgi:hypothetical protein
MSVGGAPNMNGPLEAAYVMNELVQPNSIIITHVNEQATDGGKVRPSTKTDAFHQGGESAGARAAQWSDDGVRRNCALRGWLLSQHPATRAIRDNSAVTASISCG